MRTVYFALALFFISSLTTYSQPFTCVNSALPGLARGASAFADFDNDGDLDLVMIGQDNTLDVFGKVFMNVNGEFTAIASGITGLYNSALSVADYDHDDLMDIIMTGQDLGGNATRLYRNIGGGQFQLIETGIYAAGADGDVAWGDYDNDGFQDVVLSGNWQTKLYHNEGDGTFLETTTELPAMNNVSLAWGDFDNDGDADLLMSGDDGSVVAVVMVNNNGVFTRLQEQIEGAIGGSARWGDYDMDGRLDILITGKDASLIPVSMVYRNNGDDTFSYGNAGLIGTALGPADWIDYDNDGDPDIMLSGQNAGCGNASTHLYENNGAGSFSDYPAGLAFVERAASAWGDYDNDGDYDLLLMGISGSATTMLYRNDLINGGYQTNTVPSVPSLTDIYTSEDWVVLNWERSVDLQSPTMALTYNLRVGTAPGAFDLLSPLADLSTGNRYIATTGNMGGNDFSFLQSLKPGTYYYSIQAIDQAYAGSPFSAEQTFIILPTGTGTADQSLFTLYRQGSILYITSAIKEKALISIFTISGSKVYSGQLNNGHGEVSVDGFPVGIYAVSVITDGHICNTKVSISE